MATTCPVCGCDPDDAWGCDCSNEDCPCSEPEDDDMPGGLGMDPGDVLDGYTGQVY